ncbi:hypothetical protein CWR45_01635 [Oceanobacillus chungangensis]|uniref:Uncharacterized protein n=1 Tax=Oceanobacillus chungangensis TaxID=1229152 RepID=A0A3D8Q050_9BACI|nr:hypothetical protein CWR45_01635 [Oceanobacillus chungangensis]
MSLLLLIPLRFSFRSQDDKTIALSHKIIFLDNFPNDAILNTVNKVFQNLYLTIQNVDDILIKLKIK